MEEWKHPLTQGELVKRENMLDEIKFNLIEVIKDYADLPPNNEPAMIAEASRLFTGQTVPSRDDWESLVSLLQQLATVKEQGVMYRYFIRDVSDSLGVSDLEKIKEFIDYIQTLPPMNSQVGGVLAPPPTYTLQGLTHRNLGGWSRVELSWGLSGSYLNNPNGTITVQPSTSEDVDHYLININSGSFSEQITRTPGSSLSYTFPLQWRNWFSESALRNVSLGASVDVVDKRGNSTTATTSLKYPASVVIPTGVKHYEVQWQKDSGSWKAIGTTSSQSYTWAVPRQNGNYRWRVRAVDKSGLTTPWVTTPIQFIRFIPDPPSKPKVSVSTDLREATITWTAAARADYYEIWHGGEKWAKDNTKGSNVYWRRVNANQTRSVKMYKMNEGRKYTWYVRAVNEGGQNTGSKAATMKKRVTKTVTFKQSRTRVWNGSYTQRYYASRYNNARKVNRAANWRTNNRLYQGGWREINRSNRPTHPGWDARGGGTYTAWGHQQWGNHMSFIFLDYAKMRRDLRGKTIKSAEIAFSRANTTKGEKHHGWPSAKPLYLYNHNLESNINAPASFPFYREDGRQVTQNTQRGVANVSFSRGATEKIKNAKTKRLIENIVAGRMKGLGIAKYYGGTFNSTLTVGDKAYMLMDTNVTIKIQYEEIQ